MLVLGYKGVTVGSPEIQNLTPMQLHLEAEAIRGKEDRLGKMLGKHLGTVLDIPTLESIFFPRAPVPLLGESLEDAMAREEASSSPTSIYSPLILAVRPEMTEKLKGQVGDILQRNKERELGQEASGAPPTFSEDTMDMLQAVSRMADAAKAKQRAEAPRWDEASDRRDGIDGYEEV